MRHVEAALAARGERVLLVETSGLPAFGRTRAFYRRCGYDEEARIRDFYRAGEDKVVFRKALKERGYTLVSLTNSSNRGVETQFKNVGLTQYFDQRLSIEDIKVYKPALESYKWAIRRMGIKKLFGYGANRRTSRRIMAVQSQASAERVVFS